MYQWCILVSGSAEKFVKHGLKQGPKQGLLAHSELIVKSGS